MKRQMKLLPLILAVSALGLVSTPAPTMRWIGTPAARADVVSETLSLLGDMKDHLSKIASSVEEDDKHQYEAFLKTAGDLMEAIKTDTLSPATQQQLSDFFEDFLYADAFFERVTTITTHKDIEAIKKDYTTILERRKEDVKPYTRIARLFRRIQSHLAELKGMSTLTDAQRSQIAALMAPIGALVAKNEVTGDRPCIFAEARKVYDKVKAAYPALEAIGAAPAAYWSTVYVQALNERFADYAQNNEIIDLRCKDENL